MIVACKPCPECGKRGQVVVDEQAYFDWKNGMLIQDAMPNLSADERELLITGTHPACWEAMFS